MLLITVATTVSEGSRPARFLSMAHMANTSSPSSNSPRSSMKSARSASPSRHTARFAPCSRNAARALSGCREPQSRLMFIPSGSAPTGTTSAPSSRSTSGATR